MNDFNKTLKDIIEQYRKIGFQTHYWRSKETGEVFVYMRKGEVVASMIISVSEQVYFRRLCDSQKQKEWLQSTVRRLECKITEYYASDMDDLHEESRH